MRITNSMMTNTFLNNLYNNMALLNKYQYQLSTNKRITRLSDDPTGVLKSMQARVKLYRVEQYQTNVETAQNWMRQSETSLMELNSIITLAYENVIQVTSDHYGAYQKSPGENPGDPDREKEADKYPTAELIRQLRDHVLDLGNSKFGDRSIFAGYNTTQNPFTLDDITGELLYNGVKMDGSQETELDAEAEEIIRFEIGYGLTTDVTMTGLQFMGRGEENVYKILDDLYNALSDPEATADTISPFITKLQDAQDRTLNNVAEIGGKTSRLDLMQSRYEDDFIAYTEIKSNVEDAQMAEVLMYYQMANAVYTASLQMGSRILQPSLMDYLR